MMDGSYLKKAREAKRVRQQPLAAAMGVSVSQLSRYENNQKPPTVPQIEAAAKFLNAEFMSLIGPYDGPQPAQRSDDGESLFQVLQIVLGALLQTLGASQERVQSFVRSIILAHEKPEDLSPKIPADQQIHLLTMSLLREFPDLSRVEAKRKS